jgi:molybdate/tungstate transport system ATP-binding protein
MIEIRSLSNTWDEFQLRDINLKIQRGEYFVVLGPTGAGKTLLLETIAGFFSPDKGKVIMDNTDLTNISPEYRKFGFVYQDYMLFPHRSLYKNISFGLELQKLPRAEISNKVQTIAKLLKIKQLLHRYPETLSGGELQRGALARALVIEPQVLLLDEPLSALDPNTKQPIVELIKKLHNKLGITIIHITHDREEAMVMADRIAVMNEGKIVQVGKPSVIFRRPKSEFVASFVGVENIYSGKPERAGRITKIKVNRLEIYTTQILPSSRRTANVALRPEDIIITLEKIPSSARNSFSGKIKGIIDKGPIIRLDVDIGVEVIVYITHQSFVDLKLNIGSEVIISFKASAVHVF